MSLQAADEGELLFEFESDLTVGLQKLRPDLLFLHAGAVATPEGAALLVGASGAGKSTLTWSLVCCGFLYLSDELAPVALAGMSVHPFPRAPSLKDLPPPPFEVPAGTLRTSLGFRVPVDRYAPAPRRISGIFFLEPGAAPRGQPTARRTSAAEAAARLLANALNPRSHPADALDAVLGIAEAAPAFELRRGALEATCALVRATLEDLGAPSAPAPEPSAD